MKATGIVRRIDDLGRVVIPKEIRRTMRIREGDPLEIYTDNDGEVIFKKYSPIGELGIFSGQYADVMCKIGGYPVVICDRDHVIATAGIPKKEMLERRVSQGLEDIMETRKTYIFDSPSKSPLYPVEGIDRKALVASPIIAAGDVCGAVMFLIGDEPSLAKDGEIKMAGTASAFLGKQMEE